ncbi:MULTISPECIES: HAD family hydrolase [unclassified Streptomyces]|uniref:HAD family hydrolase n=1 Tax=unclassified Streptomyces TaxID=2593676 RepID=UPI0021566543|nr:HAD hydrolase-like protein [Streptomyces sp. SM10]
MTRPHVTDPYALLMAATCVLFDFDGPLCRLFPGRRGVEVAQRLSRRLAGFGHDPASVAASVERGDPLGVLVEASKLFPDDQALLTALDDLLTAEEEALAAGDAVPTTGAAELVRTLGAAGTRLAVTTNNSRRAVEAYLAREGLVASFDGHIHGRTADPARLKPDPDCLHRALGSTGASAAGALMIGDSAADRLAAGKAGVAFLGYAENARKHEELHNAGTDVSVSTFAVLLAR